MPRPARQVSSALLRKGFKSWDSDHAVFELWIDGRKSPIHTKISHGEREIHDGLLAAMARQLKLKRAQFDDLVECPLSMEEYVGMLRAGGYLLKAPVETHPPPGNGGGLARKTKKRRK
jgi:hypothetical protein